MNLMFRSAVVPGESRPRLSRLNIIWIVAIIFGLYSSLNMTTSFFGLDADGAHGLLMWYGVKEHGLGWIKSWKFTSDNWITSIVPFHFLFYWLFGTKLSFNIFFGWAVFVLSAVAAVAIAALIGARKALAPIAVALLNLGPFAISRGLAAYGTAHNTSNLYGLLTLLCLAMWLTRRNLLFLLLSVFLLTSAALSDPWIVGAYGLPFVLACLGLSLHPRFKAHRTQLLAALAFMIGSLVLYYTQLFGLFSFIPKLTFSLADWKMLNENAVWVVKDLGGLISVFPAEESNAFILSVLSILIFAAVFKIVIFPKKEEQTKEAAVSDEIGLARAFFYCVSILSFAGGTAALVIMNRPAADYSARFMLNDLYLGAVALGFLMESRWRLLAPAEKLACAAACSAFVLSGMITDAGYLKPSGIGIRDTGIKEEAAYLRSNGLSYGYGPYWGANANAVTVATGNQVRIRPVVFNTITGMMVVKTRPQTSMQWYEASDAPPDTREWFVIAQSDGEECPDLDLCVTGLAKQFGPPTRTLKHLSQTILVWNHPLIGYDGPLIKLALNETIPLSKAGPFPGTRGWLMPEAWGTWTTDRSAIIKLQLNNPPKTGDISLVVQGHAFLGGTLTHQTVHVSINHHPVGTLQYDLNHNEAINVLTAPASIVGPKGQMEVEFLTDKPTSPVDAGVSIDGRKLGLGVEFLTVR